MNKCKKCGDPTRYKIGMVPICLNCIKEIEEKDIVKSTIEYAELITGISYQGMQIKNQFTDAKYYAMHLLRKEDAGTLSFIGDLFGVDHSTVIHGIKTITNLISTGQIDWEL